MTHAARFLFSVFEIPLVALSKVLRDPFMVSQNKGYVQEMAGAAEGSWSVCGDDREILVRRYLRKTNLVK